MKSLKTLPTTHLSSAKVNFVLKLCFKSKVLKYFYNIITKLRLFFFLGLLALIPDQNQANDGQNGGNNDQNAQNNGQ